MPTKKNPSAKLAETLGAAPPPAAADETAKKPPKVVQPKTAKNPSKTAVSDVAGRPEKKSAEISPAVPLSAGQLQVVGMLVAQGFSYDEAVAKLSGDGSKPATSTNAALTDAEREQIRKLSEGDDSDLPPIEDVEETVAIEVFSLEKREGFRTLVDDLWTRREELEDVPKKTRYSVTFELEATELDWLLHRTIQEAQARKDAEYGVQRAMTLLLKQQKALDPTRGGRRSFGGSGPKEQYNPTTGDWTNRK